MSTLKQRLKNGESIIGTMITTFMEPDVISMMQVCGLDYVIVDCEHGSLDYSAVAGLIGRGRALNMPVLVRIPEARREVVLKYMDAGAFGLLLPNCDTAEEARALLNLSKYAPMGNRGVSMLRGHSCFQPIADVPAYMNTANEDTIMMIQVESPISIKNLEEILSVEGIDSAFVGPNDLSQSMGIMGQYQHPDFLKAMDTVIEIAKKCGKCCGVHFTGNPEDLLPYKAKGMTMNCWSNDITMMMTKAREGMEKLK